MKHFNVLFVAILTTFFFGCSTNTGRYSQQHDSIPSKLPTPEQLQDAVPTSEPPSAGGNKPYTVFGKSYQVLPTANNYVEEGVSSWYGEKFHGHLTSNGEIYDMYGMSAAHKSLPLPSYVKVTNLANNKSVVVRVNDRGPFHNDRIIDLSFSAAYKLDMLATGTAKVKVEAITAEEHNKVQVAAIQKPISFNEQNIVDNKVIARSPSTTFVKENPNQTAPDKPADFRFVQVFATSNEDVANATASKLTSLFKMPVHLPLADGIFRIKLGPIKNQLQLETLLQSLKSGGYPEAFAVN